MGDRNCWTCRHDAGGVCGSRDDRVDAWDDLPRVIAGERDTTPCPGHEYRDPTAAIRARWEAHGLTFGEDGRPRLPAPYGWNGPGWASDGHYYCAVTCDDFDHFGAPLPVVLACIADAELAEVADGQ